MGNYANDPCAAAEIEQKVRERVDWALRGQAQVAEFTVGTMFEGRPALDKAEREVAVALNVMSELFGHRARELPRRKRTGGRGWPTRPRWRGTN